MQPKRLLGIKTPLGEDAFVLVRLSVNEQLGQTYEIEADVLGRDPAVVPKDLLTRPVVCTVAQHDESSPRIRHFAGVVVGFHRLAPGAAGRMMYRLRVVPKLWSLGLRRNCRMFQDKTVKEIVKLVLADHGLEDPAWSMVNTVKPIPYCTQFNETDLGFVARLLEEHGLTYFFTHDESGERMGVARGAMGFPQSDVGDVFALHGEVGLQGFGSWRRSSQVRSAVTTLEDMEGERMRPAESLRQRSATRRFDDEGAMWAPTEIYHWPGGMSTRPGNETATIEMGAEEAATERYTGTARDPRHLPGTRLSVAVRNEDGTEQKRQYVITAVQHSAADNSGLGSGAGGTESYGATVGLVLASRVWMPAPRHPRPVMPGLQSAKVTGPAGEEIHCDKYGRVKVKFRWDRVNKEDDTSSCWLRVMQAVAGAWGGTWYLPRVGDEVLVAFLEGDPDRPLVVGSVYGKDAPPPFDPGANKTQSGILTRSSKSGSASDANMLRIDDKMGSEEVLLHAQKDLNVEVENNETRDIGNDQTETIKNNRNITIDQGKDTLTLNQGNKTTTIKMGNLNVKCDMGSITMEAMQSIMLKVGGSSIELTPAGITIKGIMISDEATAMHKTKGPMVQVNGDAVVKITGAIVLINS